MSYMDSSVLKEAAPEFPVIEEAKPLPAKRARVATTVQYSAERAHNARDVYHSLTRSRQRIIVLSLIVIIVIASAFGLLLINQAGLVEANYENAQLEAQIRRIGIENSQRQERIVRNTDLAGIESAAVALGLTRVSADQIIPERRPVTDRMLIGQVSADAQLASADAEGLYFERSLDNVEQWYAELLDEELNAGAAQSEAADQAAGNGSTSAAAMSDTNEPAEAEDSAASPD